jgi:serine/threonine protein kinase
MVSKKHVGEDELSIYYREVDILKKLNSDRLIKFRDYFDQKIDTHMFSCIAMEYCDVS